MRERGLSAALFVPPLIVVLILGGPWIAALILVAAGVGSLEAMRLLRQAGYPVLIGLGVVIALAVVIDAAVPVDLAGSAALLVAAAVILSAVGAFSRLDPREGLAGWVATVFGGIYVGMLGASSGSATPPPMSRPTPRSPSSAESAPGSSSSSCPYGRTTPARTSSARRRRSARRPG